MSAHCVHVLQKHVGKLFFFFFFLMKVRVCRCLAGDLCIIEHYMGSDS